MSIKASYDDFALTVHINCDILSTCDETYYNYQNKQFDILMKILRNIAFKIFQNFMKFLETLKHEIFNSHL